VPDTHRVLGFSKA
jgi:hypothetical protein